MTTYFIGCIVGSIIGLIVGLLSIRMLEFIVFWCQVYTILIGHWLSTGQWKMDGKMPRTWRGKPNKLGYEQQWRLDNLGEDPWK